MFPSYAEDPLAQAVQGLMDGGVVVVASAGSYGKPKIHGVEVPVYGGIASPGNLPDVITVVALNTRATVHRGDDNTATCGSNGPAAAELGP